MINYFWLLLLDWFVLVLRSCSANDNLGINVEAMFGLGSLEERKDSDTNIYFVDFECSDHTVDILNLDRPENTSNSTPENLIQQTPVFKPMPAPFSTCSPGTPKLQPSALPNSFYRRVGVLPCARSVAFQLFWNGINCDDFYVDCIHFIVKRDPQISFATPPSTPVKEHPRKRALPARQRFEKMPKGDELFPDDDNPIKLSKTTETTLEKVDCNFQHAVTLRLIPRHLFNQIKERLKAEDQAKRDKAGLDNKKDESKTVPPIMPVDNYVWIFGDVPWEAGSGPEATLQAFMGAHRDALKALLASPLSFALLIPGFTASPWTRSQYPVYTETHSRAGHPGKALQYDVCLHPATIQPKELPRGSNFQESVLEMARFMSWVYRNHRRNQTQSGQKPRTLVFGYGLGVNWAVSVLESSHSAPQVDLLVLDSGFATNSSGFPSSATEVPFKSPPDPSAKEGTADDKPPKKQQQPTILDFRKTIRESFSPPQVITGMARLADAPCPHPNPPALLGRWRKSCLEGDKDRPVITALLEKRLEAFSRIRATFGAKNGNDSKLLAAKPFTMKSLSKELDFLLAASQILPASAPLHSIRFDQADPRALYLRLVAFFDPAITAALSQASEAFERTAREALKVISEVKERLAEFDQQLRRPGQTTPEDILSAPARYIRLSRYFTDTPVSLAVCVGQLMDRRGDSGFAEWFHFLKGLPNVSRRALLMTPSMPSPWPSLQRLSLYSEDWTRSLQVAEWDYADAASKKGEEIKPPLPLLPRSIQNDVQLIFFKVMMMKEPTEAFWQRISWQLEDDEVFAEDFNRLIWERLWKVKHNSFGLVSWIASLFSSKTKGGHKKLQVDDDANVRALDAPEISAKRPDKPDRSILYSCQMPANVNTVIWNPLGCSCRYWPGYKCTLSEHVFAQARSHGIGPLPFILACIMTFLAALFCIEFMRFYVLRSLGRRANRPTSDPLKPF